MTQKQIKAQIHKLAYELQALLNARSKYRMDRYCKLREEAAQAGKAYLESPAWNKEPGKHGNAQSEYDHFKAIREYVLFRKRNDRRNKQEEGIHDAVQRLIDTTK